MILWIVQEGKKTGPFEDYEVREMIREGKVKEDTGVWHEGAEGWVSASQLGVLTGEFERPQETAPEVVEIRLAPFRAWSRLGARVIDFMIYRSILHLLSIIFDVNLMGDENSSGWLVVGILLPVILVEAAMVGSVGFSPGKWLFGMRVETVLGQRLSMGQAFVRSMRVWVLGMGMFLPLMMVIGLGMSLWFGRKKGGMLWDLQSGFQVIGGEMTRKRAIWFWVIVSILIAANILPYLPEIIAGDEQALQEKLLRRS